MHVTPGSTGKAPRSGGFTLIELLIVIVILGLLATLIAPRILDIPERGRRSTAVTQVGHFKSALALFKIDTGRFPTTSEGLNALVTDPGVRNWKKGGYLEKVPLDPWGNPYVYLSPGREGRDFDVVSYGKDGEPGGADDDADVESWNLD
jgi:general secretion pathway protein G